MRSSSALLALALAACTAAHATGAPAGPGAAAAAKPAPTWFGDVAPIVARRCQGCHVAGGIGPFALVDAADAASRHEAIARAVEARTMPPWLPADGCRSYVDERRLTDDEIATIAAWSRAGAPSGDPAPPPSVPQRRALRRVDATVDIGADYVPRPSEGPLDEWRCFLVDPGFGEDRIVAGYDLVPTVRSQVHHAAFVETTIAEAQAKDDEDPRPGWACPGGVGVPARVLGSWAAGFGAVEYAEGTGMRIAKGKALAVQIHYHLHDASAPALPDRTRIAFELLPPGATAKEAALDAVAVTDLDLPPRSTGTTRGAAWEVPSATTLWGAQAHMHRYGARVRAEMVDGATRSCLLDIPRWNYHWEEMHFFASPVVVPKGARVELTCTWDNPTDHDVRFGLTLEDEMCDLGLVTTPP